MPSFNHSTQLQLAQRLRERFKTATRMEALQVARFFAARTDAQLKAFFGLTDAQTTALRAKLDDMMTTVSRIGLAAGQ